MKGMKWGLILALLFSFQGPLASANCGPGEPHVSYTLSGVSDANLKLNKYQNDAELRSDLIQKNNVYFLKTPHSGGAYIVLEPNYLSDPQFKGQAQDIADALEGVPNFLGRGFGSEPVTYYLYRDEPDRPSSYSAEDGIKPGKWGVMLSLSDSDQNPTFHETTHLTEKTSGNKESESLSEGFADYVQEHCRPGKEFSFHPKDADPDLFTQKYLENNSDLSLVSKIGSRGDFDDSLTKNEGQRYGFYYASDSFVKYLLKIGTISDLLKVEDAGGASEAYQQVYSKSLEQLRREWLTQLGLPEVTANNIYIENTCSQFASRILQAYDLPAVGQTGVQGASDRQMEEEDPPGLLVSDPSGHVTVKTTKWNKKTQLASVGNPNAIWEVDVEKTGERLGKTPLDGSKPINYKYRHVRFLFNVVPRNNKRVCELKQIIDLLQEKKNETKDQISRQFDSAACRNILLGYPEVKKTSAEPGSLHSETNTRDRLFYSWACRFSYGQFGANRLNNSAASTAVVPTKSSAGDPNR
jgi:hypothetical protein